MLQALRSIHTDRDVTEFDFPLHYKEIALSGYMSDSEVSK